MNATPKNTSQKEVKVITAEKIIKTVCAQKVQTETIDRAKDHLQTLDFTHEQLYQTPAKPASKVVMAMDSRHAWQISLSPKLIIKAEENGQVKNFLIGYENGLTARKNETHFAQKETDNVSHRIEFQPCPHFISYSFFYGFFEQTIKRICEQVSVGDSNVNLSNRKNVLKLFQEKYAFKYLEDKMAEYAEAMIENIIDIQAKVGEINGNK